MSISHNLSEIQQQIQAFSQQFARKEAVQLLAVSKTKSVQAIQQAIDAGQRLFGENYVQEGVAKIQHFASPTLEWHFIGPLQSNKTRLVAEHFAWVQTLDRLKIAERLNEQRPASLPPLQVLIQINISDEASKSGIAPEEMLAFAEKVAALPNLTLRGLMAIPKAEQEVQQQKIAFTQMQHLFKQLQQRFPQADTLSMGMSGDMQSAIECGSTMVRIGTAIFGSR